MSRLPSVLAFITVLILLSPVSSEAKRDPQRKWLSKKPFITKVEVIGNEFFSEKKIKGSIRSRENGFWQSLRLRKRHRLKKDSKKADMAALIYLYRTNGFLDAEIDEEFVAAEDSSAIVRITVNEGRQYIIRKSTTPSELGSFEEKIARELRKLRPGMPLDPYAVNRVTFDVKTVYANAGYPYANVRDSIIFYDEMDSVDVVFFVDRGPLTLFGEVFVDSLEFTQDVTFRRELLIKPGDLYSREKIVESRQRVYSTGLASYVALALENPLEESQQGNYDVRPDFRLKVRERKPKFAKVKTGASQDEKQDLVWDVGLEFGSRNISGKGRGVTFELSSKFLVFAEEWRVLEEKFAFEYREPWLFKTRTPLNLMFSVQPGIRSQTQSYRISTIDLGARTSREITRHMHGRVEIVYEKVNITGIPADQVEQKKKEEGISVKRKLIFALDRDTRNNPLLPIRGTVYRVGAEYVGGFLGGDEDFVKLTTSWSRYQNFYGSNIYAWNYRFGWVVGTDSDPYVPTTDRFYFGGGKTLRGYRTLDVGPRTPEGELAGGRVLIQTNQEIRRPLFWKLWASLFIDVGNIYEDFDQIRWDNLLVSGGVGVQYISPVGPIRLDYGHRLIHDTYPRGGRFHFSILYAF